MFQLPNEDELRTNTSYTNVFMLTLVWNVGIFCMILFGLFIISLLLKLYNLQKHKQIYIRQSLLTYEGSRNSQNLNKPFDEQNDEEENPKHKAKPKIQIFDVINFITSLSFYLLSVSISSIYLSFYAFGQIGHGTAHDIMAVVIMWAIVTIPTVIWKANTRVKVFKQIKKEVIFTAVMLVIWLGLSIFLVIALKQTCICVFNDNYGVRVNKNFYFSTQFSRQQQIQKVCGNKQVCHLYATLPEQTSTSVFINVQTGLGIQQLSISMTSDSQSIQKNITEPLVMDNMEQIGQRNIFSIYFNNLKANTLYNVTIYHPSQSKVLKTTKYKTVPNKQASQIRMAVGGDVGFEGDGERITEYLVDYNPDVLIIGGDIAYDDGMRSCYYSWDNFYMIFQNLNDKVGRLVPMILSIGNHDVGYDALADVKIQTSNDRIPYFFLFNPQHITNNNKATSQVPVPQQRRSYHSHIIGPMIHIHLDSGYVTAFEDQTSFIELMSTKHADLYKFANYHNPIYPSCTNSQPGSNDVKVIEKGTKHWTPIFDKINLVAAFEHHTHHRKFTKKLKNGTVSSSGARYIGDGSWGVPQGKCGQNSFTKHPQLFDDYDTGDPNHIWEITIKKADEKSHIIDYIAIDIQGKQIFNQTDYLISG